MRRILVTGGAGFIGANFLHYWSRMHKDDFLVTLDALTYAGNRANVATLVDTGRLTFVHGSIADGRQVRELMTAHKIDTIVNFAAETHVDRSISGPAAFVQTNVLGTFELLEAARELWLDAPGRQDGRFHHVSTDEVFGSLGATQPAFSETTPYAPNSPYAASKAGADHLVRAYSQTYGLGATTSNCSNNYGPYQFPEKLIPLALLNALEGMPIPIYGDGMQIRDWIHVEDHCRAIDLIIERGAAGEVYNVGAHGGRPNIEIVRLLCSTIDDLFRADANLRARYPRCPASAGAETVSLMSFVKDRPGHDRRYAIDGAKIERELGFVSEHPFERGIRETIEWYLHNEPWWRQLQIDKRSRAGSLHSEKR